MKLTYAAMFYGPRSVSLELPAEWHEFEDGAEIDVEALGVEMVRHSGFPAKLTCAHYPELRMVAEGYEIYTPPKTIASGNGYHMVWTHGDVEQYVRKVEEVC